MPNNDHAWVVRFENVGLRYGLGPEVLQDVSFGLAPGSIHFLLGASGAREILSSAINVFSSQAVTGPHFII